MANDTQAEREVVKSAEYKSMSSGEAGQDSQRVEKKGKRYYTRPKRQKHPLSEAVKASANILGYLLAREGDGPSVTTVLGTLAKPALISWAARQERLMIAKLSSRLYERLSALTDEPLSRDQFEEMVNTEAGKGAHLKLLAKAANVGTEVHARVEWEFKGELELKRDDEPPKLTTVQAERAFERWTEWRASVNLRPIAIEKRLYSTMFGYGGTLDLLAEVDAYPDAPKVDMLGGKLAEVRKVVVIDFKTGKHIYSEAYLQNVAYRTAIAEEGIHTDGGIIVRLPKYLEDPEFDAQPVPDDPLLLPTFLSLLVVYQWWEKDHDSNKRGAKRIPKGDDSKGPTEPAGTGAGSTTPVSKRKGGPEK